MRQKRSSKALAMDKISGLPDEVLCRFLSLVTTKEAVATSVLSKRWTHLWRYLNNIDFDHIEVDSIESISRFNDSVNSVLISRDAATSIGSHYINSFFLSIFYGNPHFAYHLSFPNIVKWVNLAVQRKLNHLSLNLDVDYSDLGNDYDVDYSDLDNDYDDDYDYHGCLPKLSIAIFTCKTLVSLDLFWFSVKGFSFSSIGFGFPSLKTLHLNVIDFAEDRDFILLLFGCPVLEDLELYRIFLNCDEEDSPTIQQFKCLSLPKLIRAEITQCLFSYFPLKALSTSESMRLDTFNFNFKCYTQDHKVFHQVSQPQPPYDDIPIMFHNLTYLELHNSWHLVVQVLHHCPNLQNLKLYKESYAEMGNEDDQENWVDPEFVPQCLLSHLRTCTIQYNVWLQSKLMLAKYILKNANFLQSMTISSEMEKMKLAPCPKASATCQLLVDGSNI